MTLKVAKKGKLPTLAQSSKTMLKGTCPVCGCVLKGTMEDVDASAHIGCFVKCSTLGCPSSISR